MKLQLPYEVLSKIEHFGRSAWSPSVDVFASSLDSRARAQLVRVQCILEESLLGDLWLNLAEISGGADPVWITRTVYTLTLCQYIKSYENVFLVDKELAIIEYCEAQNRKLPVVAIHVGQKSIIYVCHDVAARFVMRALSQSEWLRLAGLCGASVEALGPLCYDDEGNCLRPKVILPTVNRLTLSSAFEQGGESVLLNAAVAWVTRDLELPREVAVRFLGSIPIMTLNQLIHDRMLFAKTIEVSNALGVLWSSCVRAAGSQVIRDLWQHPDLILVDYLVTASLGLLDTSEVADRLIDWLAGQSPEHRERWGSAVSIIEAICFPGSKLTFAKAFVAQLSDSAQAAGFVMLAVAVKSRLLLPHIERMIAVQVSGARARSSLYSTEEEFQEAELCDWAVSALASELDWNDAIRWIGRGERFRLVGIRAMLYVVGFPWDYWRSIPGSNRQEMLPGKPPVRLMLEAIGRAIAGDPEEERIGSFLESLL